MTLSTHLLTISDMLPGHEISSLEHPVFLYEQLVSDLEFVISLDLPQETKRHALKTLGNSYASQWIDLGHGAAVRHIAYCERVKLVHSDEGVKQWATTFAFYARNDFLVITLDA